jgi:hypothetical protein
MTNTPDLEKENRSPAPPAFGVAEQLLMDEARARVEFEQKASAALHTKSALFLTLVGVYAAIVTALASWLLDRPDRSPLESAGLATLGVCLALLTAVAVVLVRSAFSRAYQMPALPGRWADHLAGLRTKYWTDSAPEVHALAHLQYDLLDGWLEAAEECAKRNDEKARTLERVVTALASVAVGGIVGLILVLWSALS